MHRCDKPVANPMVVIHRDDEHRTVLFNPCTAEAIAVGPVGLAAWRLMDGRRTLDEIAAKLGRRFENVPGIATPEVQALVAELSRGGFVGYEVPGP